MSLEEEPLAEPDRVAVPHDVVLASHGQGIDAHGGVIAAGVEAVPVEAVALRLLLRPAGFSALPFTAFPPNLVYEDFQVPDRATVTMRLNDETQLMDSFPEPSGGEHRERTWDFDRTGGDIDYVLERPRDRAWMQPIVDLLLLLAGVALGLLPSMWRRS
jgi:hypothetical protein